MLYEFYLFLKSNDVPNILILCFTGIVWPIILFLWNRKTVNNINNFEVSISFNDQLDIRNTSYNGIVLTFLNNTGSIVYLTNARISKCTKRFMVCTDCTRDIADSSYELKFSHNYGLVDKRQITIQTNEKAYTCLGLRKFENEILLYSTPILRKIFKVPKYFCLSYIALVGDKKYKVVTVF